MLCNCIHFVGIIGLAQPNQASIKIAQCIMNNMFCLDSLMDSMSGSKISNMKTFDCSEEL